MALSPTAVHDAATDLLNCVCQALDRLPVDVPGLAGCPCRSCVVPGQVAADGCDGSCPPVAGEYPGQLSVNVTRLYSSDRSAFPREVATVRDLRECAPPPVTVLELAVTLFRCTPLPDDQGCPPSCEELTAAARQLHADLLAVQAAVLCCFAGTDPVQRRGRRYVLGQSRTMGPQGGCVGLEQLVRVALDDCITCPPVAP